MYKIILFAVIVMLCIYYLLVLLQIAEVARFTKRELSFWKALLPFYYFINAKKEEI